MFFFWAFASMFGYAIQDILLVKYARKIDALSLAIYRNTSFIITLLPLLFFTSFEHIKAAASFYDQILLSGISGACAVWLGFQTYRYLPVGIFSGLGKSIIVITLTAFGYFFFDETISLKTFALICFILGSTLYLGIQKNHMPHLKKKTVLGFLYGTLSSFVAAISIFLMIKTSRELNPYVAGYFWETTIGIIALLFGITRSILTKRKIQKVKPQTFFKITLAASPTLVGTGSLAIAATLGPVGIVSTISVASIIVVTLLAHYLYNEKLTKKQWTGIAMVTLGIVVLKLSV